MSVRIQTPGEGNGKLARFEGGTSRSQAWAEEDEERFLKLKKKQKPFSLAFLDFAPDAVDSARAYHSLMAVPIHIDDAFSGGIIAYDKRPAHALEDATFSPLDSTVIDQIIALAVPVARALSGTGAAQDRVGKPSYENVIQGNLVRLKKVIEAEMARADRYHHAFALIILRIKPLDLLFEKEHSVALALIEEINTGIQTRTRKTDYGTWMRRDTFAMLSLEGTRRVKFLISRLMLYLLKDFSAAGLGAIDPSDVLIGHAIYPGSSRTPESMLQEVESILQPRGEE
ncbi:MAG: hypothetical protein IH969_08480 [Candidatus Krumholzibacteriota bacterium]|nr:hypothetical protein [Candidatus Krumholzibacteriota bacterium]